MSQAIVTVEAMFAHDKVDVVELYKLKVGDILKSSTPSNLEKFIVYLDRRPKFLGLPAVANDRRGVKLIALLTTEEMKNLGDRNMSIRLGHTHMLIKGVLQLEDQFIVKFEERNSDPADLLVHGRIIARGEIMVIEDKYGIRLTELALPS